MVLYIIEGICVVSFAGIVYLLIRTYPIAHEQTIQTKKQGRVNWDEVYKLDAQLLALFEKFLRKARVMILKVDHTVSQRLDRVKRRSAEHGMNTGHVLLELEKKEQVQEKHADVEDTSDTDASMGR